MMKARDKNMQQKIEKEISKVRGIYLKIGQVKFYV